MKTDNTTPMEQREKDKLPFSDWFPIAVALSMSLYWGFTGDMIRNDPYLLGLFRGVIWSTLIFSFVKLTLNFNTNGR